MDGETVAVFGQLHPELAAARKLRPELYVAEVMLDRLYRHSLREPRYQRISKFPAVEPRLLLRLRRCGHLRARSGRRSELQISPNCRLRSGEIYRGEKVGAGKYSVLLHAEFQSKERTLRDDEVAQWSAQIITKLEALGGVLRAQ